MKSLKKLVKIAREKIEEKPLQKGARGVPSGFNQLDKFTNGWQPGQLIVIAARPGMGISALTKAMILNAAIKFNQAVAVFSLSQSAIQYISRMITFEAEISEAKLTSGDLEPCELYDLKKSLRNLSKAPIFIDDNSAVSLTDLRRRILKLKSKIDIKLIVVDYLQLMTFQKLSLFPRKQEIDIISRNLKKLAKELNLPIIVLSSLPSGVEKRKQKRPKLSDLRRITNIERYADIVAFIYRPEYYGIEKWSKEVVDTTEGQTEIIIAKNRNGWLNNFRLRFDGHNGKYSDVDPFEKFIEKINKPQRIKGNNYLFYL
jgi:replicative DNA helicase